MATHAYSEKYLSYAQTTLATMFDYAVNYMHDNIDQFFAQFVASGIADQFGMGYPNVITGKSGVELYHDVKNVFCIKTFPTQYFSVNRTPEFWFGYYLAYAQWSTNRTFRDILFSVLPSEMLSLYNPYHEMDPQNFADLIEQRVVNSNNNLKMIRMRNGYGQTELANISGVELRNIQSFEQRKNNITKAQFDTLNSLSSRLNCSPNDLTQSYDLKQKLLDIQIDYIQSLEKIKHDKDARTKQINDNFVNFQNKINKGFNIEQQRLVEKYINQFPYNSTAYYNNNYYINKEAFNSNLQNYWDSVQQGLDVAKEMTNCKPVKIVADSFGILNAKNVIELAYRIASLIDNSRK